jgi:cyanophycin synthetase
MGYKAVQVYRGPSVYSQSPVIRYTLEVPPDGNLARDPRSFTDRLFGLLPRLREHPHPCDVEALLVQGNGGTGRLPVLHLFEHLCIELQNLTGAKLGCVSAQGARIAGDDAVIPYDEETVGLEAGNLSLELIESLSGNLQLNFERRLQKFVRFAERRGLPVQDQALVRAAEARDIPVIGIAGRLIQLGHGRHQQRMNGTESTHTTIVSNDLAANKDYARRVFRAVGLPVPRYERVYRKDDAVAAAKRIGFPVVVKPNDGNMGAGVSVGMRTNREVRDAFDRARPLSRSVLVEEFVPGVDYRMLVINGKLVAAAKRVPAHVVGDGVHTIEELVRLANEDPRRGAAQRSPWTRLEFDDQSDRLLAEISCHRNSIAGAGETIYLRRIANTSAGGTAVDITDQVHPENREIAERAAMTIGLDIAGVDLLVQDITQPMRAQGGVICEINSRPGIRKHLWPGEGQPRDVIGPILGMLFPPGSPSRVPIAVVTGFGDTDRAARMLADLLSADGSTVGLAASNGVFINGKRADGGGMEGPAATRMLLLDPAVDRAVIVVHPGEALQHGLGYDWADACAVINDQPIEQPDLVEALRLVVTTARSHVFLLGEQPGTHRLKPHPAACVWRVSADGDGVVLCAKALAVCLGSVRDDDIETRLASLSVTRVQ